MPYTWTAPVTDRDYYRDVYAAKEELDKKKQDISYQIGLLKGCLNYTDLNRIENNMHVLAEMLSISIPESPIWTNLSIPAFSAQERILTSASSIRADFLLKYPEMESEIETVPELLMNWEDFNQLERLQLFVYENLSETPAYDETKIAVVLLDENMQKTSDIHYTDTVNEAKTFINANSENLYHVHVGEHSQAVPNLNGDMSNVVNLYSIDIPNGVKKIPYHVFYNCTALFSMDIPDSVTEIERESFTNCTNLSSVTFGNGITSIDLIGGTNASHGSFENCTSLTEIYIPENVKSIGGIDNLAIGSGTFSRCSGLKKVTISGGVETIGSYAFSRCTSLENLEIQYGVKKICNNAFEFCSSLETVILPDSIEMMGRRVESAYEHFDIDGYIFQFCTNLKSIKYPANILELGKADLAECHSLQNVVLPENLEIIGVSCFANNTSLENIVIPDTVRHIGLDAFHGCSALRNIILPDELYTLGHPNETFGIFESCSSLLNIVIPTNVRAIGGRAFSKCTSLIFINVHNRRYGIASDPWGAPNFISAAYAEQLAERGQPIPAGKNLVAWNGAGGGDEEKLAEMALLKEIDSNGLIVSYNVSKNFSGIRSILSENIDKTFVVELGDGFNIDAEHSNVVPADCFTGLTNIKSIYIPQRFRTIEENAFSGCTGLEFIHIDKQKREISGEPWGAPAETIIYYSASLATNTSEEMINTKSMPFAVRTTGTDSAFDTKLSGILLTNTEPEEPAENTLYLLKESSAFKLELNGKELKL